MATLYLVRHGQPDYSGLQERGMFGFGRDFAPLSPLGVQQAEETARDPRLKQAERIVSSPYTRARQTAQIISLRTGIAVQVEPDLHEWVPDWTNQYRTSEESFRLSEDFVRCKGECPAGENRKWESLSHIQERMQRVLEKYAAMDKVILVGHRMAFRTICYMEEMRPGEIVECVYEPGQKLCEYIPLPLQIQRTKSWSISAWISKYLIMMVIFSRRVARTSVMLNPGKAALWMHT